jgi:hypothetical protein
VEAEEAVIIGDVAAQSDDIARLLQAGGLSGLVTPSTLHPEFQGSSLNSQLYPREARQGKIAPGRLPAAPSSHQPTLAFLSSLRNCSTIALMALARAVCSTSCSFFSDSSRIELPRHSTPSTWAKLHTGWVHELRTILQCTPSLGSGPAHL